MVANNVNHAKWATGETRSCSSLEFKEWTHWVRATLWDEASLNCDVALSLCFLRHECSTDDLYYSLPHSELVSLMCFIHLTISVPFSPPYIKQTKGWVMVSESRLSFINGFRLSGVSGWWIVRMSCNGCGSLSCDVLFVPSENTCVIQCLVQLIITL